MVEVDSPFENGRVDVGAESTGLGHGRASRTGETRVGRDVPSAVMSSPEPTGDTAHGACPGSLIAAPGAPTGRHDAPGAAYV
jgi:hypothetical protein